MSSPPFVLAQGVMQIPPDYAYRQVGVRGFPLAASMEAVELLVDECLNQLGGGQLDYRPIPLLGDPRATLVYMMLSTYGSMASTRPPFSGWGKMSQNEILFNLPLLCYQDGRLTDISFFCPYCCIDNSWSLVTGNMVLGYPKGLAAFQLPAAISDPYPAEVRTPVFPVFHPDSQLSWELWIRITAAGGDRGGPPGERRYWPFGDVDRLFGAGGRFAVESAILELLKAVTDRGFFKVVQLRQLRDLADDRLAAYSSLVSLTVRLEALRGQGLLHPAEIKIWDFASLPVLSSLGIDSPQPILPFWVDIDFDFIRPQLLRAACRAVGDGPGLR